jgi:HSP20 family protein
MAKDTREALQRETARYLSMFRRGTRTTTRGAWAPAMDVWETDDAIVYAFDLPGIARDTLSIEFDNGVLRISAERERSQEVSTERLYRFERRYGTFSRAIGMAQGVSQDQISARYDNGELEVHVKKPEVETPHLIQIGNGKAAIEGTATDGEYSMRVARGLDRLLGHCELVNRMTALPERDHGGKRLERELGPELTYRLVSRLLFRGWTTGEATRA